MGSEEKLIAWLAARTGPGPAIGDDCAFLPRGGDWAVTVDSQIAGTHFPPDLDPRVIARRLLAVNLSDMAAIGGAPRFALLALAAPSNFAHKPFFRALLQAAQRYGTQLIGGDLAKAPQVTASLTLLGQRPTGGKWVRRSSARAGDSLWVSGQLGESAAGYRMVARGARPKGRGIQLPSDHAKVPRLAAVARRAVRRHLIPTPELALGKWLGRQKRAAALDVSDGLAKDLGRLCEASQVGAILDRGLIEPTGRLAELLTVLGADPLFEALGGGEDYVLLFSLPEGLEPPGDFGCIKIGRVTANRKILLRHQERTDPLPNVGWDHLQT